MDVCLSGLCGKRRSFVVLTMMSLREAALKFVPAMLGAGAGWIKITSSTCNTLTCPTTMQDYHNHVHVQPGNVIIAYHLIKQERALAQHNDIRHTKHCILRYYETDFSSGIC